MAEQRRITKQFLLEHLEDNEMDLSMTDLTRVPVKELVSACETYIRSFIRVSAGSDTSNDQAGPISEPPYLSTCMWLNTLCELLG